MRLAGHDYKPFEQPATVNVELSIHNLLLYNVKIKLDMFFDSHYANFG